MSAEAFSRSWRICLPARACVATLLHAADVTVEPSDDFLDDLAVLGHEDLVPAGISHVALVGGRRPTLETGDAATSEGER